MAKQKGLLTAVPAALTALSATVLLWACGGDSGPDADQAAADAEVLEASAPDDDRGPTDFGAGSGVDLARSTAMERRLAAASGHGLSAPPDGGADGHLKGAFGPAFNWPVIPIHQVLLADGRVMSYGSDLRGQGGAQLNYVVWDPNAALPEDAFMVLDNVTRTDLFCGTQLLLPESGELLMLGGTRRDVRKQPYGTEDVTTFNASSNTIRSDTPSMASKRWYATAVTMADGEQVVMGGRDVPGYSAGPYPATTAVYSPVPEVRSADGAWHSLSNASSDEAYGSKFVSWSYPRAWLAPNGHVFLINKAGYMYDLDHTGTGQLSKFAVRAPQAIQMPSVMYEPGKILSLHNAAAAVILDINGNVPVLTATAPLGQERRYGNATVLPDGKVFVNGGSNAGNTLEGAVYPSETWDPQSGAWTQGASASKPRLYHSTSMLLPDGSVLTGGGGKPGPVRNLNAEIYYPPYFFDPEGSGGPSTRPVIVDAPASQLGWSQAFNVVVDAGASIGEVRLIRTGSVTHAFNNEQRAMTLPFTREGDTLQLHMPASRAVAPPGFYMLFVVTPNGIPSIAKIVKLNAAP